MLLSRSHLPIGLWALAFGLTGFVAGFFGPILLNPEANQGPLLGLFITGPGGALGGAVLGTLLRFAPFSRSVHAKALIVACLVFGLGTLYFCLPQPKVLAHVIDAEAVDCSRPSELAREALDTWQDAVQRATWYTPPADWQQVALRNLSTDTGLVLTVRIARRATFYQHRKPWDFGRRSIGPWEAVESPERYYVNERDVDCATYLSRPRQLYLPFVRSATSATEASREWPPTDVTSFLRLMELGPVPIEYRTLIEHARK